MDLTDREKEILLDGMGSLPNHWTVNEKYNTNYEDRELSNFYKLSLIHI